MDDPVIQSRGMELHRLAKRHVDEFLDDISIENQREFDELYRRDPAEALLAAIGEEGVFAVVRGGKTLAITGVFEDSMGDGVMWALFTESMKKSFVRFVRASEQLLDYYHERFPTLVCNVWTENHMIHQWLAHLGFQAELVYAHNDQELVRFVRYCEVIEISLPFGQRPVFH